MNRKIQLIWDFKGKEASLIAKHHKIHLDEYLLSNPYSLNITGTIVESDFSAFAYLVVEEIDMIKFRDILKPHRAQVYEQIKE